MGEDFQERGENYRQELGPPWVKQPAETTFIWSVGSLYPSGVICTVYETNQSGEKRLVEQKEFSLYCKAPEIISQSEGPHDCPRCDFRTAEGFEGACTMLNHISHVHGHEKINY